MKWSALLLILAATFVAGESSDWVAKSNRNAEILLQNRARFFPEGAGKDGVSGVDEQIIDLNPNLWEREMEAAQAAAKTLKEQLPSEKDPLVRQDLEILIAAVRESARGLELRKKYYIAYLNVLQIVYSGVQGLLDDQVASSRRPAALARLKKY